MIYHRKVWPSNFHILLWHIDISHNWVARFLIIYFDKKIFEFFKFFNRLIILNRQRNYNFQEFVSCWWAERKTTGQGSRDEDDRPGAGANAGRRWTKSVPRALQQVIVGFLLTSLIPMIDIWPGLYLWFSYGAYNSLGNFSNLRFTKFII